MEIAITSEIRTYLINHGYYQRNNWDGSEKEVFQRYADGKKSIVCLFSNYSIKDTTKDEIQKELDMISKYENVSKDRLLIIGLSYGKPVCKGCKGYICMDLFTNKIYGRQFNSSMSQDIIELIGFNKLKKLEKEKYDLSYGYIRSYHDSASIYILIALNVYFFTANIFKAYTSIYALDPIKTMLEGESYRLLTYIFLHGNLGHLISNMLMLLVLGKSLLKRQGAIVTYSIYIGGGILGGICSCLFKLSSGNFNYTVGASGAIFALLGALVIDNIMERNISWNHARNTKKAVILLILSSLSIRVDTMCHIGGFLGGMLLMYIINKVIEKDIRNRKKQVNKLLKEQATQ